MQNLCCENEFYLHVNKKQSNLCITALYVVVTRYITVTRQLPKNYLPYIFCKVDLYILAVTLGPVCNGHIAISQG